MSQPVLIIQKNNQNSPKVVVNTDDDFCYDDQELSQTPLFYAFYHLHCMEYLKGLTATEVLACQDIFKKLEKTIAVKPEYKNLLKEVDNLLNIDIPYGKIQYREDKSHWVLSQAEVAGVVVAIPFSGNMAQDLKKIKELLLIFASKPFSEITNQDVIIKPCSLYQDSFQYQQQKLPNYFVAFFYDIDGYNFWVSKWLLELSKLLDAHLQANKPKKITHELVERPNEQDSGLDMGLFVGGVDYNIKQRASLHFTDKPDFDYTKPEQKTQELLTWSLHWPSFDFATFIYADYQEIRQNERNERVEQ